MPKCQECHNSFGVFELKGGKCISCRKQETPPCQRCQNLFQPSELTDGLCTTCKAEQEKEAEVLAEHKRREDLERQATDRVKNVLITTESNPDLPIIDRLGIVSSECVFGMNIITHLFSSVTDVVGGRSKSQQTAFRNARETVLQELKMEAAMLGGNAVVAVKLDYSEISGGGKSMLFLVGAGTAVKIGPN